MTQFASTIEEVDVRRRNRRIAIIAGLLILTGLFHWITPTTHHYLHSVHIVLRKLFIIPIVLGAIWFDMRGAVLTAAAATLLYAPHVIWQWAGQEAENVNQVGEMATMWLTALVAGLLVRSEKAALHAKAEANRATLIALVAALDAREHETQRHSVRVRDYALRIGREMGLSPEALRALGQGSLLHDVGKVGTPDSVLLKPGPLDEDERRLIREHPETGHRILASVPFLKDAAEFVRSHHERYNGSGYPDGLRGEEIPLAARIFAVADVFDALTSDRVYHRKIDCEAAREVIRKESGSALDPSAVDAFLRIPCEEWSRIARRVAESGELPSWDTRQG